MTEIDKNKFSFKYLLFGEGKKDWYKALGNGWRLIVIGIIATVLVFGGLSLWDRFFPKKQQATSTTTVGTVEAGGVSTITNINNPLPDLKQGIYVRAASDRASIGVFKEVMSNIDISIGGGKDYDDKEFVEIEARWKF